MEFTLVYQGPLPSGGSSSSKKKIKHEIRKLFHPQLKNLTNVRGWEFYGESLLKRQDSIGKVFGEFTFIPFITSAFHYIVKLDITLLRPEPPRKVLTQSGDIDNRLKILFDALSIPQNSPTGFQPDDHEDPFFCLLEEDSMIFDVRVQTHQWLASGLPESSSDVILTLKVEMVFNAINFTFG